jgi:hypothetical protein
MDRKNAVNIVLTLPLLFSVSTSYLLYQHQQELIEHLLEAQPARTEPPQIFEQPSESIRPARAIGRARTSSRWAATPARA